MYGRNVADALLQVAFLHNHSLNFTNFWDTIEMSKNKQTTLCAD